MTAAAPPPRVVLYSRPGCHLCVDAAAALTRLAARHGFEWAELDIASDPELERRYLVEIPVIAVDGVEVTSGRVDMAAVRRAVLASPRSPHPPSAGGTPAP